MPYVVNWTIGQTINVHQGKDGKVRNVTVKTQTGQYARPINKIAVIYPADGYDGYWYKIS